MPESRKTYLYLIRNSGLSSYKIGVADLTSSRIAAHLSHDWELVSLWKFDDRRLALLAERRVLNDWTKELKAISHLSSKDMPQRGATETVDVADLLDKICKDDNNVSCVDCELSKDQIVIDRIEKTILEINLLTPNLLAIEGVSLSIVMERELNHIEIKYSGTVGDTYHEIKFLKSKSLSCGCEGYSPISRYSTIPIIPLWLVTPLAQKRRKTPDLSELVKSTLIDMQNNKLRPCRNLLALEYYGYSSRQIAQRIISNKDYEGETVLSLTIRIRTLLEREFRFDKNTKLSRQERTRKKSTKRVAHWTYGDKIPIEGGETLF
jgi:hypothetical protein